MPMHAHLEHVRDAQRLGAEHGRRGNPAVLLAHRADPTWWSRRWILSYVIGLCFGAGDPWPPRPAAVEWWCGMPGCAPVLEDADFLGPTAGWRCHRCGGLMEPQA